MVRRTAPEVERSLSRHGLVFRSFTVSSEGMWSEEDADWNYKDVPHLNVVHTLAKAVPAVIEDEVICTVNLQKMLGIPMPIALVNYVAPDGSQVYYTTMLFFVLVVETRIAAQEPDPGEPCRTKVDTTYHVGGPRMLAWLFPIMRRMLAANYKVLMSEDLPMREQRGRLRSVGYRFASDGRTRTFAETTDLTVLNVVAPPGDPERTTAVDLAVLRTAGATTTVGDGPAGLRIVKGEGSEIMVFDRVCSHEGACLDAAQVSSGVLVCPWHAKRNKPLAVLQLDGQSLQRVELGPGRIMEVEGTTCRISGV
jgi:hypothetical protein